MGLDQTALTLPSASLSGFITRICIILGTHICIRPWHLPLRPLEHFFRRKHRRGIHADRRRLRNRGYDSGQTCRCDMLVMYFTPAW